MNIRLTGKQRAAGNRLIGITGALLCVFFIGCGDSRQTISVPLGEALNSRGETVEGDGEISPTISDDAQDGKDARQDEVSAIYVHVCGAVNTPGVVMLPEGSRGQDALDAAGGFAPEASEDFINLAELLTDGMQLYFPTREEAESLQESEREEQSNLININTAGVELLCTLPGIGEARAKAIVEYRESNGNFETIEDIMQVSGIKDSAFGKIKDLITVK